MKPLLFNKLRDPITLLVVLQKLRYDALNPNEPAGDGLVYERGLRAPAEGVGVSAGALVDQSAFFFQSLHDGIVSTLLRVCVWGGGGGR